MLQVVRPRLANDLDVSGTWSRYTNATCTITILPEATSILPQEMYS